MKMLGCLYAFVLLQFALLLKARNDEDIKYSNVSYIVVVARYNEEISWLSPVINNCFIYNKGDHLGGLPHEIPLPNVGRESDTYLQYIVTNYENFPDIVVFTQARISDHRGSDDHTYLLRLRNEAIEHFISRPTLLFHQDKDCPDNRWDPDWNYDGNGQWFLRDNYYQGIPLTFQDYFLKYIGKYYPNPFHFTSNAIFAVQSKLIRNRPKSFYETLLQTVHHHNNPVEGGFIEKSWYYIFLPHIPKSERLRQIAKAPWARCRDVLQSLPALRRSANLAKAQHLVEFSILSCGLYPFQSSHYEENKFPTYFRAYSGRDGVGLWQYPHQFASYLLFLEHFFASTTTDPSIFRYVEVGSKAGGSFIITTEFLRRLFPSIQSVAVDVEPFGIPFLSTEADAIEPTATPTTRSLVLDAYEDNFVSYISMHSFIFVHGNVKEFFRLLRYPIHDLVFMDSEQDWETLITQQKYLFPFSRVLVYSRIVDHRYPDAVRHWQALKALYPSYDIEFTNQYQDELLSEETPSMNETTAKDNALSYFGIGVLINPIYYACEGVQSPSSWPNCQPRNYFERCLKLISSLSLEKDTVIEQLSATMAICGLSNRFLIDRPLLDPFVTTESTFQGLGLYQSPAQFINFVSFISEFSLHLVVDMHHVFEDVDSSLLMTIELLKQFHTVYKIPTAISAEKVTKKEIQSILIIEESYEAAVEREWKRREETLPEREEEYARISSWLNEYFRDYQPTTILTGGIDESFWETIQIPVGEVVDLWMLDVRQFSYSSMIDIINLIVERTSKIAFMHVNENPHNMSRVKKELKERYGEWQWVDIYSPYYSSSEDKYFGIGLFLNPQYIACTIDQETGMLLYSEK